MSQLPLTFDTKEEGEQVVCLFSGGLDSTVLMWYLTRAVGSRVMGLCMGYGQRHGVRERTATVDLLRALREQLNVPVGRNPTLMFLDLPPGVFGRGSALLKGGPDVPKASYEEMGTGPRTTEVPFRNATFLSLATSMAMQIEAKWVSIAAHRGDHDVWSYPDCSPPFLSGMRTAIEVGSNNRVSLIVPFLYITKAEIVAHGEGLGVPFELTWSCYGGGETHCGGCPTCLERRKAFAVAGVADPTTYKE